MASRVRLLVGLGSFCAFSIAVACGSDPADDGSSSGSSGASSGGSSSGTFGTSGGLTDGSSGGANDGNPANCLAPVDMYIMFDRSGSMGNDCNVGDNGTSKWCLGINALSGYLKSMGAANQAAALQFFPIDTDQSPLCKTGDKYAVPAIPATGYTDLPSSAFDAILNATTTNKGNNVTNYGTPTEAAIRGLTRFTKANRRPGRVTIGILITDGDPHGCDEDLTNLSNLLQAHYDDTKIRTYVIGMTGATDANLEKIAKGGNAPSHADTVGTATNVCGSSNAPCIHWNVGDGQPAIFQAALAAIQDSADGCKDGGGFVNPGVK